MAEGEPHLYGFPQDKKEKEKEKANDETQDMPETSLGAELESPKKRASNGSVDSLDTVSTSKKSQNRFL